MGKKQGFTLGLALVMFSAAGSAFAQHSSTTTKRPGFTARVTNPWYPLKPGSRYVYRGVKNGETSGK